jgi:tRNA threonylcarbamoyladenosine biosynthesis protein TsaE
MNSAPNIYLNNLEQTKHLATKLAKLTMPGDVITFSGDLGVGKTSFIQYFVNSLSDKLVEVTSPTFNLVHIYNLDKVEIWHFDLYRLNEAKDLYELGIEDAFNNGIALIEWPEISRNILPKERLELEFSFGEELDARVISYNGFGKWKKLLGDFSWDEQR